jgi:hypothetical protein
MEDLGRGAYTYKLEIPLFRGMDPVVPGSPLYPDVFEALRFEFDNPDTLGEGEFVDPEIGPIQVKVVSHVWRAASDKRNGGVYTVELEENSEDPFVLTVGATSDSETEAQQQAADIDQSVPETEATILEAFSAAGEPLSNFDFTPGELFVAMADDFFDWLDEGALAADDIAARLDSFRARIDAVLAFDSLQASSAWSVRYSLMRLSDTLTEAADRRARSAPTISEFLVPARMSHWEIANRLYGDRTRAREIFLRNPTLNPNFYSAGTTLLVLSV